MPGHILTTTTELAPRRRPTSWLDVRAWVASVLGIALSQDVGPTAPLVGAVVLLGLGWR